MNLMAFSVVDNTSVGSKRFLDFSSGHTWGSPTSITGNRVLDPTGDWAMILDNAGPYLVVDNVLRLGDKTRGVRMTWADQTLVGNVYSKDNAVEERGRFRRIEEKVVAATAIPDSLPALPIAPPRRRRRVFDIPATADAAAIQKAIDQAAGLTGQRPVVHLPMGAYKIDRTLVIPRACDVQLVGDGASEIATRLVWTGPADGVLLRVDGPSRATIRDLQIQAGASSALLVETPDQPDARIFADQLNTNGPTGQTHGRTAALRVTGFERTRFQFRALQGSGNGGTWVEIIGQGSEAPGPAVGVFTGATGTAAGQYDVRQGGRLVVRGVYHERSSDSLNGLHLTSSGTLSIDATRFSYATSKESPTVAADNFRGLFTLATCMLMPVETQETCRFELRGDGSRASVLALNDQFWVQKPGTLADTVWLNRAQPPAKGGLIGSNINTSNKAASPRGFAFLNNVGENPRSGPLQLRLRSVGRPRRRGRRNHRPPSSPASLEPSLGPSRHARRHNRSLHSPRDRQRRTRGHRRTADGEVSHFLLSLAPLSGVGDPSATPGGSLRPPAPLPDFRAQRPLERALYPRRPRSRPPAAARQRGA